jgi:hypothetical protein
VKFRRRAAILQPLKEQFESQPILYRRHVGVKTELWTGWSAKTLASMELIVRESSIQVTMTTAPLGHALGCEWYFASSSTFISVARRKQPRIYRGKWILLTGAEGSRPVRLALMVGNDVECVWSYLLASGAVPEGESAEAPPGYSTSTGE